MKIIEVKNDKTLIKEFLNFPVRLYKHEPNWIRPLDKDVEQVFNPKTNKAFETGECVRWIFQDEKGQTVGRVAAFISEKTKLLDNDQPTGGLGFFDCINDKQTAFLIFDTCKNWLKHRGIEAMDGSINFGSRDKFWGVLADSFQLPNNYQQNYNFAYYNTFFDEYGFKNYFNQFTFVRIVGKLSEAFREKGERIDANPDYHFEKVKKNNLLKYATDFVYIYNNSFALSKGIAQISVEDTLKSFNKMKPIMDERLMWFGYHNKTEPVAAMIFIPELNELFKHVNGKMNLWGTIKFLYHKWSGHCTVSAGKIFGVTKAHSGRGLDAGLAYAMGKDVLKKNYPYKTTELYWIGDFNLSMLRLMKDLEFDLQKTHITYRLLFDDAKEFKRHPVRRYEK